MPIGAICNREVIFVQRDTTVLEAAQLMRQYHVGALVVVETITDRRMPVGLITDRDLVVEVLATGLDASVMTAGDIMQPESVVVTDNAGLFDTIRLMRDKAVRRLPVVDGQGELIGIVTLDDLQALLVEELGQLSALVAREQKQEYQKRR